MADGCRRAGGSCDCGDACRLFAKPVRPVAVQSVIERYPERDAGRVLDEVKRLRRGGWELTALHDERTGTVLVFGYFDPFGNIACGSDRRVA